MKRTLEALIIIFIPVLLVISLLTGRFALDWANVFSRTGNDYKVFLYLRVGRTLAAAVFGFALGLSGAVFQIVFRNNLATPDVVGITGGASVGAAIAIVFGLGSFLTSSAAFIGGALAVIIVICLAKAIGKSDTATLLMSGIIVNALFKAILMLIKLSADTEQKLGSIEFWTMGSFSDVTLTKLLNVIPFIIISSALLMMISRPIKMLALSDDEALTLGVNVRLVRTVALLLATVLISSVISIAGPIVFVPLIAPLLAREMTKQVSLSYSGLLGMDLLLISDIIARSSGASELPISIVTSLIGAPTLFALIICKRRLGHE